MIPCLAALISTLLFCSPLEAAQLDEITGAVAYTDEFQFDYTKDGVRKRVQFWLQFTGSPSLGNLEDATHKPESGAVYYYLVDLDNKKKVDNWLMGFSMMEEPPPSGPYPMTNIQVQGNTAKFTAFGMNWTVVDGGEGFRADTVTVDDGFTTRKMKLFAGDLRVIDVELEAIAEFNDCADCHEKQATALMARGGKHTTVGCAECHVGHPPEEEHSYIGCMECHEPHSDQMDEDSCAQCHRAHTATDVQYAYDVPSAYCFACHAETADVLASSRSKHSTIDCVRCHQDRHTATSTCQYCHGGPHPQHVMTKPGICAACHQTAHALQSARER